MSESLTALTRKIDRGGDRRLVDEVFDSCLVATLCTVIDGLPWAVPTLVVRDGDRLLLHGSTGAGALRHLSGGAPVAVSAFLFDGVVVAERQFDHSANYRSAVVRGTCRRIEGGVAAAELDRFTDALLPGRPAECPPHTQQELAATMLLELAITPGNWVAKQRSGPPSAASSQGWTGVIPAARAYGEPIPDTLGRPVPRSVAKFLQAPR